jgi:DNA invertase Pin-like site-specific DNA recombinase
MGNAAVWLRVSTDRQETANQAAGIEKFCTHHGHTVTETYRLDESAWNGGKDGGEYRAKLKQALDDMYHGEFCVLIVSALDRLAPQRRRGHAASYQAIPGTRLHHRFDPGERAERKQGDSGHPCCVRRGMAQ